MLPAVPPQHRTEQNTYVIDALGVPEDYAPGTVRLTLGKDTTKEEVDAAVESLKRNVKLLRCE